MTRHPLPPIDLEVYKQFLTVNSYVMHSTGYDRFLSFLEYFKLFININISEPDFEERMETIELLELLEYESLVKLIWKNNATDWNTLR
jgi:hypothetical protein